MEAGILHKGSGVLLAGLEGVDVGAAQEQIVLALIEQRAAVLQADWNAVEARSLACLGLGCAMLRILRGELRQRAHVRERFASGVKPTESPLDVGTRIRVRSRDLAIVAAHRGLLGLTHASFNQATEHSERRNERDPGAKPLRAHGIDVLPLLQQLTDQFALWLEQGQTALYNAIVQADEPSTIEGAAAALALEIDSCLPQFARAQAGASVAMRRLRVEGKGMAAEKLGRQCVRAGLLTRHALASHVSAHLLGSDLQLGGSATRSSLMRPPFADLPFNAAFPDGHDIELARIGDVKKGAFVQIRAFVTSARARRLANGMLVSILGLEDPSSGATAEAAAIFAHLPHAGVTPGTVVDLNGLWEPHLSLLDGRAGVKIDTLALATLSQRSWRLAFLHAAEPWFAIWPNGANIAFSLAPQRKAPRPDAADQDGAGELLFRKWLRL